MLVKKYLIKTPVEAVQFQGLDNDFKKWFKDNWSSFYDIDGNLVDSFENNLSADTNTTGISDTEAIITSTSDIFTIDGRKVDGKNLKPGIYIKNGKKYIVK
jgi:hypothetical protein